MGTMRDWLFVAFCCVFWGGGMLALEARRRKAAGLKTAFLPASTVMWMLNGLIFGLWMTFESQAFRSPLVFITAGSLMCSVATAWFSRHERVRAIKQPGSLMKTVAFFVSMGGFALLLVPQATLHTIGLLCLIAAGALLAVDYFQSRRQELGSINK